jgi:hypothetical protein
MIYIQKMIRFLVILGSRSHDTQRDPAAKGRPKEFREKQSLGLCQVSAQVSTHYECAACAVNAVDLSETDKNWLPMPVIIFLTTMDLVFVAAAFAILVIVYRVYHRYTCISLADVPGPEPASFIMGMPILFSMFSRLLMQPSGNTIKLFKGQVGEADFEWQAQYGDVVRFKGPFGVCNDIHTRGIHFLIS